MINKQKELQAIKETTNKLLLKRKEIEKEIIEDACKYFPKDIITPESHIHFECYYNNQAHFSILNNISEWICNIIIDLETNQVLVER